MYKKDVIAHFGSVKAVADALNIHGPAVSQWGEIVPRGKAFELAAISGGALKVDPSLYEKSSGPTAAA